MKRLFLILLFSVIASPPANAINESVIRITGTQYQNFNGEFRNNSLLQDLTPSGRLGQLVFSPIRSGLTWVIDPALVDEVIAMTGEYKISGGAQPIGRDIAKDWIQQLISVTKKNNIIALAYGNPDIKLAKQLAPSELMMYYAFGKIRLEIALGRAVQSGSGGSWSQGKSGLSNPLKKNYTKNRQALARFSRVVNTPELELLRARLGSLLSPNLDRADRSYFSYDATSAVMQELKKLRIIPGKYQLTSEKVKVPVTIINKYEAQVFVNLSLTPSNSRVLVSDVADVSLEPNSKITLSIPVRVIAPGSTIVQAQLTDSKGGKVTEPIDLQLNLTVVDSRVAWFTTGAAILLLLAGVAQSVRRVRRSRK